MALGIIRRPLNATEKNIPLGKGSFLPKAITGQSPRFFSRLHAPTAIAMTTVPNDSPIQTL